MNEATQVTSNVLVNNVLTQALKCAVSLYIK